MSVSSNADQDDLFSAHDFDIHIDLPTNSNGKCLILYMVMFVGTYGTYHIYLNRSPGVYFL